MLNCSFFPLETRKMQQLARDNVRRILEEQEKLSYELEAKKKKIDERSRKLNKLEASTERERQRLDEERKKVTFLSHLKYSRENTVSYHFHIIAHSGILTCFFSWLF